MGAGDREVARRGGFWRGLVLRFHPGLALARTDLSHAELGRLGEAFAARALRATGCRILARRLKTRAGEIDLLALEAGTLIAVEVKTGRQGPRFRPGMRCSGARLAKLRRAAASLQPEGSAPVRVDLMEVVVDPPAPARAIHHRGIERPL